MEMKSLVIASIQTGCILLLDNSSHAHPLFVRYCALTQQFAIPVWNKLFQFQKH